MPWLTASKLPDLLLFAPHRREGGAQGDVLLPSHILTPDGEEMPVFGEDLAKEVGRRYGGLVEMMQLRHGIFDEASICSAFIQSQSCSRSDEWSNRSSRRDIDQPCPPLRIGLFCGVSRPTVRNRRHALHRDDLLQ